MFTQDALLKEMHHLRRFAMRLTRNVSDADDLLQSTLLRAMEYQHRFETGTNLFRWCSKIMFNLFASSYRRRTKFETQYDPHTFIDKESVEPTQEVSAEIAEIGEAMNLLSPDHRALLIMICAEGMSYEEVAESLQIPVGTVRSRLSRARYQLQAIMDRPDTRSGRADNQAMPVLSLPSPCREMQRRAA